ncbi:MAG: flagellar M-ring protein FliF [Gemmatimonadetes bacterium]|nr:flagellar M-ring protein FliF [Gemmatimonadota bacterium]
MPPVIQDFIDRIGTRRALIIGIGIAAATLIFGLARWASQPQWVPAFTGIPLESAGQMTDKLDQAGVQYKLERGGADILVAAPDLAKARVALARGGVPNQGRPGFELFDQPSWGLTDFTQRINYRRALEGELERTVGKMRGIESAQVHLVVHETQGFGAADKPAEASVVLKLRSGADAGKDVVTGIAHLLASSVDGLTSDHVTVVDDAGRLLSEADEPSTPEGVSNKQLQLQRDVEDYLRTKAERLLGQVVGHGNAKVQVNASINFDRIERKSETLDPNTQSVASETKSEITPGAQGGAAQTNSATTYENTRMTETFSGAIGNLKRVTVAVVVADKRDSAANAKKPTFTPRTPEELAQIESLVRSSIGLDSARGDRVSVVGIRFEDNAPAAVPVPRRDIGQVAQDVQRPVLGIVGLALAFVIAFLSLKAIKQPTTVFEAPPVMSLPRAEAIDESPFLTAHVAAAPVPLANALRDRIAASVQQQPDVAARLVRAWIKEG